MTDRSAEGATNDLAVKGDDPTDSGEVDSLKGPVRLSQYGGGDFGLPTTNSGGSDGEKGGHQGGTLPDPPENRLPNTTNEPAMSEVSKGAIAIDGGKYEPEDPSEKIKVKIPRSSSDHL